MAEKEHEIDSSNPAGTGGSATAVRFDEGQAGQGLAPPDDRGPGDDRTGSEMADQGLNVSSTAAPGDRVGAEQVIEGEQAADVTGKTSMRGRWTVVTIACALLLTLLSVAGIILVTRPRATIDQLLILTVPSGADVTFDGKALGPSPVKLEGVRMGTHKILVTKDGYQEVQYDESITDSRTLDYKLKLLPPPGAEGLSADQALNQYKQNMEDAFARGDYAIPYPGKSALYYAQLILDYDYSNPAALEMKDRVRDALVQSAHAAMSRVDLAQAQEIVSVLGQFYPNDEDARAAAAKLENQIAIHRSDVREFIRKAEDALRAGNLIDPPRASAYYYSKQALTLDRQNQRARAIKIQVRDDVLQSIEQTAIAGNLFQATRELNQALKLFPEDAQLQAKQKDLEQRQAEEARANDPSARRRRGLDNYRYQNYADAVPDLEYAVQHERGTPEVLFALGACHKRLRDFDQALDVLSRVPRSSDDSYPSALALQGEIQAELGNIPMAIERYKQARDVGGSTQFSPADLQDRIDKLERKQSGRVIVEPTPLAIKVKHLHGGILHGTCAGTLSVNSAGVRYDSDNGDHVFSANLLHAGVRIIKDEMGVSFQGKNERFKPMSRVDAERFSEAVARYHSFESAQK